MAEQLHGLTHTGIDRTRRTNAIVLGTAPRVPGQRRRVYDGGDDGLGGTGGSGCCCEINKCLKLAGVTTPIKPTFYKFIMPRFRCYCDDEAEGAWNYLYQVDPLDDTVWESEPELLCKGTTTTTIPCTNTATWNWVTDSCGSTCQYISVAAPECALFHFKWVLNSDSCASPCNCPAAPHCNNLIGPHPTAAGQVLNLECAGPTGGHWVLASVSDPDCDCTPAEPTFDGEPGVPATTECDGFKTVDATATSVPSKWRLTIARTRDYRDCDLTKLEFLIGADVIFTYYLTLPCAPHRGFCRDCVNSFTIIQCGPSQCRLEPAPVICLEPGNPEPVECPIMNCGFPVVLKIGFALEESFFNSSVFSAWLPRDAASLKAVIDGDYLLFNTAAYPCIWNAAFPSFEIDGAYNPCSFVGCSGVKRCRIVVSGGLRVICRTNPLGPGVVWEVTYGFGWRLYLEEDDYPCHADGDQVAQDGYVTSTADDGTGVGGIAQNPVSCTGSFNIPGWEGVEAPVSLTVIDGTPP